jgi:hypothetical protein
MVALVGTYQHLMMVPEGKGLSIVATASTWTDLDSNGAGRGRACHFLC